MLHNIRRIPTRTLQRAAAQAADRAGLDDRAAGRLYRTLVRAMAKDRDSLARAIVPEPKGTPS